MRRLFLSLLFLTPLVALAQDKKPDAKKSDEKKLPRIAIYDPAKLKDDTDFKTQGEYLTDSMSDQKLGVHAFASGDGTFTVRQMRGGLPGAGWDKPKVDDGKFGFGTAKRTGDSVVGKVKTGEMGGSAIKGTQDVLNPVTISDGKLKWGNYFSDSTITLSRVERKSPTLGEKPPAGAIVLFDKPEDIANWEKCKVEELSDGKFLGVGGRTKQKFQSFTLHIEFRLPWMPNSTGQQRGNSGVYIQDRYELQVLDSFGLKGVDNECGGIYKESAPKVNMCFPPMTWQTYDIDFTAATFVDGKKTKPSVITVKHNGVIIHDKLELKSNTPGGGITKEVSEPGAIYLQNHGDPVVYRNIWIVEKK
ncbi:hypothetical protein BH11PLA2_BH11PLA2_30270 [soil metagenome]